MTEFVDRPYGQLVGIHVFQDLKEDVSRPRRAMDVALAMAAMPVIILTAAVIWVLNHRLNPGPLFFAQIRMGANGHSFRMWKFRTMVDADVVRGPDDAVEHERITVLGRFLRRTRIDELPNFLNVLNGEMSLIGPRPDCWDHAVTHCRIVPHYAERIRVAPGITGLAQVKNGYADSAYAVRRKARLDAFYVKNRSLRLDLLIIILTLRIIMTGEGAK